MPPVRLRQSSLLCSLLVAGVGALAQPAAEAPRAMVDDARKATAELVAAIRGELLKAIETSGPLRAMVVCKYTVPEVSSSVSRRFGARVTRVSLTARNPVLGWADPWEQRVLMSFDERVARGEKADGLEYFEVVSEPSGRYLRYLRALPMQPACLHCHGPADQVSESIRQLLEHEYPHDRAIGIGLGKVRGGVTFKKPLP